MSRTGCVAFDLGAESGRAILAVLEGDRLEIAEVHRFANLPQLLPSGLHWSLVELWGNLIEGLRRAGRAAEERGVSLVSVGVDTWGVDFGLVGKSGQLLGLPFAYRDARNIPAMKRTIRRLTAKTIYDATGIQFMQFNTLFQLVAQHAAEPGVLKQSKRMLMLPDLLHYFLSGKMVNEATIASTTQMIDPRNGKWAVKMIRKAGVPTHMLVKTTPAGSVIGKLSRPIAQEAGVSADIKVIVPGSHDTASAVAAVPVDEATSEPWAYLSSGTWSLMGAELDKPIVSEATHKAAFTNEGGVGGKIRFLKNIAGLWLVQECRRDFARRGQEFTYQQLMDMAAQAEPFRTLVDPNHGPFATPGDMPAKITAFAKATNQPAPTTPGQFVRCCLESLSMAYRHTLATLDGLLGRKTRVLHIVGGGGQNLLLNQMTADATGIRVIVGPFEATAIGNALAQGIGSKQVRDLAHLRAIVRASFNPITYEPVNARASAAQAERFEGLMGK
ncbi:MAG: rhamnulokinase [Planctomycetes bacterium]|nr:rhamnulokinase [Planctomycetota bacterium]